MLDRLKLFIKPPVFPDDEDKSRKAAYAHAIALIFSGIALIYGLYVRLFYTAHAIDTTDIVLFAFVTVGLTSWWLIRRGYVRFASILLLCLIWLGANGIAASGYGIRDTSFIINFVIMLIAALLLGWQAAVITTVISMVTGFALAYAETQRLIVPTNYPVALFAQDMAVALALGGFFVYLLISGLENAIKQSKKNLKELETANVSLHRAQAELQTRTMELTASNAELRKRSERLRAIAEVADTASSVQNFDLLLDRIASAISKQLGYYHVGIFLVDDNRQYAVLSAANSEGGQRMLERGHRLRVGEQGIVGFVTSRGEPRIALDVGEGAVLFDNPDLPETHSEFALPLKLGQEVVGALDIQSKDANAFTQEDVDIFSILANQVSVAIQNARSLEQAQFALQEAEIASRQLTGQAWNEYTRRARVRGYRYDGIKTEALNDAKTSTGDEKGGMLIPIQLRGQTIGRLRLKASDVSRSWTEDELAMIQATAERVALALDGARLLTEAQKRAARETFLSEMGTKLGASFQLDSILRDTVEELGNNLKGSTVTFQLVNPSAPFTAGGSNGSSSDDGKSE